MANDLTCTGCGEYAGDKITDAIEALQAENARMRVALEHISVWRAECHEYDAKMGHQLREFDDEDWRTIEVYARAALQQDNPEPPEA